MAAHYSHGPLACEMLCNAKHFALIQYLMCLAKNTWIQCDLFFIYLLFFFLQCVHDKTRDL